jgi:hypothetical protein
MTSRIGVPIALVLLLPMAIALVIVSAFAAGETRGYVPLSYQPPRNLAEAAGMGIAAEALRYLREGADPNEIVAVRPDIISSNITRVTGLEAAIWSRRVELVRALDREGAIADPAARSHIACLARHLATEDILSYLAPHGLTGCDPDAVIEAIEARSPQ